MSVSALAEDGQPSSPDTEKNSPSPPALVPSEDKPMKKRVAGTTEGFNLKKEALAFGKFLAVEEARLRQEEPTATRISIEKKLTMKWTGMNSRQRLAYLDPSSAIIEVDFTAKENVAKRRKVENGEVKSGFTAGLVVPTRPRRVPVPLRPGSAFNKPNVEEEFVLGDLGCPVASSPSPASPKFKQPDHRLQKVATALGLGASNAPQPPPQRPMETPRPRLFMSRAKPQEQTATLATTNNMAEVRPNHSTNYAGRQEMPQWPHGPSTAKEALDMFYLALCAPAFPHPDESPLTPQTANFYYDAYLRLQRL